MNVIATIDKETYICSITHKELEQFLNLYYNKMERLKVGDAVDLGKGYKFHNDAEAALKKTREFIDSNKGIVTAIMNGISVAGFNKEMEVSL